MHWLQQVRSCNLEALKPVRDVDFSGIYSAFRHTDMSAHVCVVFLCEKIREGKRK